MVSFFVNLDKSFVLALDSPTYKVRDERLYYRFVLLRRA
jgi:hypothetical protein